MNEEMLENLDNDSLVKLLSELEKLDSMCDEKISEFEGESNE